SSEEGKTFPSSATRGRRSNIISRPMLTPDDKARPPTRSNADQWFARFRDERDPECLGRVFDATARQLYQLACHLMPGTSDADDLLQATFMLAIENCGKYRDGASVLSWLFGIMLNEARNMRRRAGKI